MGLNAKQAKEIPILSFLESQGVRPVRKKGEQVFFFSPFREERTPSFNINLEKNTWFDFGAGEGGNILDLAMKLFSCDFKTALQKLTPYAQGEVENVVKLPFLAFERKIEQGNKTTFEILAVQALSHPVLLKYLVEERKINRGIALHYLKEIRFKNLQNGRAYFAFGWKNQAQGYEIRNALFKSVIGEKAMSFYPGDKEGVDELWIFEGMTDFLSWLTIQKMTIPTAHCIILNSLSFLRPALDWIKEQKNLKTIQSFLDNDEAGIKATDRLLKAYPKKVFAHNNLYHDFKDLNEYLQSK